MSNPFIEPYDHFTGYRESIEKLRNDPTLVAFDKMCYMVFENNPEGKRLLEYLVKRFLLPRLANTSSTNYGIEVIDREGFKDCIRMFMAGIESHSQRIKAETNKA